MLSASLNKTFLSLHDTHISLNVMDTARSRGVILLTIPPHTSHRLQPLDRSVYGPLKTAYNRAIDVWLRSNPGKTVTIYEIPTLVNQTQMIAMTARNITAGFQATGIHPFNRDIFSETDFAPAAPPTVNNMMLQKMAPRGPQLWTI